MSSPDQADGVEQIPLSSVTPPTFRFRCYDIPFDAEITCDGDEGAQLTLSANLGNLPYTVESAMARQYLKAVVKSGKDLPHAEITLNRNQSIELRGTMNFDGPPSSPIACAAVIVIAAKPLIDLVTMIRDAGKVPERKAS